MRFRKKTWMIPVMSLVLALVSGAGAVAQVRADEATETLRLSVKGLVCSFCAQGLQKKFSVEPGVSAVDVKLKDRSVTVTGPKGRLPSPERIAELVQEAGFKLEKVELNGEPLKNTGKNPGE